MQKVTQILTQTQVANMGITTMGITIITTTVITTMGITIMGITITTMDMGITTTITGMGITIMVDITTIMGMLATFNDLKKKLNNRKQYTKNIPFVNFL